ncbi:MAG: hypothetical protein AAGK97_11210, partial [Bacteroidota bacterium]
LAALGFFLAFGQRAVLLRKGYIATQRLYWPSTKGYIASQRLYCFSRLYAAQRLYASQGYVALQRLYA